MPELPDVTVYVERIQALAGGQTLERVRLASPFLVRSVDPPIESLHGTTLVGTHRLGKQIVLELSGDLYLIIHLMIAGRFQWREPGAKIPGKVGLAAFDFTNGTLLMTEASTKKRASIHVTSGAVGLSAFDRGGLEVMTATISQFAAVLRSESHTVKRSLTDPALFSGIGNAYSDEILHRARLSPVRLTRQLTDDEITRLHSAVKETLTLWVERLRAESEDGFPTRVTAFRSEMAVHGKYGQPCPDCGSPVQRIVYAENECNYCATCQTGGKLLADRGLSRLLKSDWPRSLEEMEQRKAAAKERT